MALREKRMPQRRTKERLHSTVNFKVAQAAVKKVCVVLSSITTIASENYTAHREEGTLK
jgi:hypothetical protein